MTEQREIPWRRYLTEGAIIVTSILLAFWIDAWWDERKDREDEEQLLGAVQSALNSQLEWHEESLVFVEALRNNARRLLVLSTKPESSIDVAELDSLLESLTWHTGDPVAASLASLLSAENLKDISNLPLRYELGEFSTRLALLTEIGELAEAFFFDHLMPFLQHHASLPQISNLSTFEPGNDELAYPVFQIPLDERVSHWALLQDPVFQNLLVRWNWRLTHLLEWNKALPTDDELDVEIGKLLDMIQAELD